MLAVLLPVAVIAARVYLNIDDNVEHGNGGKPLSRWQRIMSLIRWHRQRLFPAHKIVLISTFAKILSRPLPTFTRVETLRDK